MGIQVDEPMAFPPLREGLQTDGSLKKHEQNFKSPGMCLIPKMYMQQFCNFDDLKNLLNLKVSCMYK